MTSSAGRLFDSVAALVWVAGSERVTYEGQAAMGLEALATGPVQSGYPFNFNAEKPSDESEGKDSGWIVATDSVISAIVEDVLRDVPSGEIAARFHRTVAEIIVSGCLKLREECGVNAVALSGGAFQNALLFTQTLDLLTKENFVVYAHRRVPCNDGGLSLGQAILADRFTG